MSPWPRDRPPDVDRLIHWRMVYGQSEQAAISSVATALGLDLGGKPWTREQLKALVALREEARRGGMDG